jgi:hypothetical protein
LLVACLGTKMRVPQQKKRKKNFASHTRAPFLAPSARAGRVGSQEQARVSRHVSNTSQQRERERERKLSVLYC